MRSAPRAWTIALPAAALALSLSSGCAKKECVSDQAFFENNVLPVLQKNCQACHNPTGDALETEFVLRPASQPDYIEANLEVFRRNSTRIEKGKGPLVLIKPTRQIPHQGEKRFDIGSAQYKAFEEMLQRFDKPTASCPGEVRVDALSDVKQLSPTEAYRKRRSRSPVASRPTTKSPRSTPIRARSTRCSTR
ncbi:MAG: hypothetical protein IT381_21790 [Deltaproteobacteria bacterium]|nr:hypothetical protein [Deltaproteobacteria bacterium]